MASAILFGAASVLAWSRTRGYELPENEAAELKNLSAWEFIFLQHAARRLCAADRSDAPSPDRLNVAGFLDKYIGNLPTKSIRDLKRLFAFIEHVASLRYGYTSRFTHLSPADQDRVLHALEESPIDLLREGFAGLKACVFIGYYRDARTWKIIGYPGPLVGLRPNEIRELTGRGGADNER